MTKSNKILPRHAAQCASVRLARIGADNWRPPVFRSLGADLRSGRFPVESPPHIRCVRRGKPEGTLHPLIILAPLLLCLAGCSTFSSLHRPLTSFVRSESIPVRGTQLGFTDPSNQEFAIAWETARLAEQRGMDREAIDAFLQVRKHDPSKPGVAHALAVLYDRSGKTDAASREYQTALAENPSNADLHCDFGYFLYSTGETERAEASLREALRLQPEHPQATINLALVVGDQGRYEEAQGLFTQAIGPAAALHNVGMLRLRAGEVEAAKAMLAEAKRRDPSISVGAPVLERLAGEAIQPVSR